MVPSLKRWTCNEFGYVRTTITIKKKNSLCLSEVNLRLKIKLLILTCWWSHLYCCEWWHRYSIMSILILLNRKGNGLWMIFFASSKRIDSYKNWNEEIVHIPLICSYWFFRSLNARMESRENWTPSQNGRSNWVEGGERDM